MATAKQVAAIATAIVDINANPRGNSAWWIKKDLGEHLRNHSFRWHWLFGHKRFLFFWPTRLSFLVWGRSTDEAAIAKKINCWWLSKEVADATIEYLIYEGFAGAGFSFGRYKKIGRLFRACLYRVAFSNRWHDALTFLSDRRRPPGRAVESVYENEEFEGAYRIYLKRAGLKNVECRLLILSIVDHGLSFVATEISEVVTERRMADSGAVDHQKTYRVRFGPVVPSFDVQTLVLSDIADDTDEELVKKILDFDDTVPTSVQKRFAAQTRYRIGENVPLLQAQDLQFYAIRYAAEDFGGTFHSKEEVGHVEGQRLHRKKISLKDLQSITPPVPESNLPNITLVERDILERFRRRSYTEEAYEAESYRRSESGASDSYAPPRAAQA